MRTNQRVKEKLDFYFNCFSHCFSHNAIPFELHVVAYYCMNEFVAILSQNSLSFYKMWLLIVKIDVQKRWYLFMYNWSFSVTLPSKDLEARRWPFAEVGLCATRYKQRKLVGNMFLWEVFFRELRFFSLQNFSTTPSEKGSRTLWQAFPDVELWTVDPFNQGQISSNSQLLGNKCHFLAAIKANSTRTVKPVVYNR